jgi:hemerythrin superfamily protein
MIDEQSYAGDWIMAQTKRFKPSLLPATGITQTLREDHGRILALFRLYLAAPFDSRSALMQQILRQIGMHLEREEEAIFETIRKSGPQGRTLVEHAEMEHEELKATILELEHSESDDDQAMDELFEDMMQTVGAHFEAEERDLFPLAENAL